jgi:hypothetical protein
MSVHECLERLGGLQANFISSLDFLHAYWQLALDQQSQPLTAFTVPGKGKFVWTVSPMGLKSSPSAFTRLMDFVFRDLPNTVIYLDDVLVGSKTFQDHITHLAECLIRVRKQNMRLKISKCNFANKQVEYLGYTVSNKGIQPGEEKIAALKNFPQPSSVREIRRFCGLANYFRQFIPNFAMYSGKLTALTKTSSSWKGGALPAEAQQAFLALRQRLCTRPILAFPVPGEEFQLFTDASLEGGFGAILMQRQSGVLRIIACASRTLHDHERNYSAFLLEMAAAVFGIEAFHVYLYDTPFTLLMDHKPLEPLGTVHKRTLNRLQQLMNTYTFQLMYHPGKDNILADALSRAPAAQSNATNAVLGMELPNLRQQQQNDEFCGAVLQALEKQQLTNSNLKRYVSKILQWCFLKDSIAYISFPSRNSPQRPLLLAPKVLHYELIRAAHSSRFSGHGGIEKTISRLRSNYWWPSMALDVQEFVQTCQVCQNCKDPPFFHKNREPLHPLPTPDMPNVRIHADLIVVPKPSPSGSKYILVITCAFSKLVELVPLPSKDAATVASAIFTRWICRYSCPREILTDRGTDFCSELSRNLYTLLGIDHKKTSSFHPQTNASCERFNRELEKILMTMLDHPDDDWEQALPVASLIYNTSVHSASKHSPFFLTFLHDPNLPYFELNTDRPLYGTDWATTAVQRMKIAYRLAQQNIIKAGKTNEQYYNRNSKHQSFKTNDEVLIKFDRSTLKAQNKKFSRTWFPFIIVRRLSESTYLVQKILPSGALGQTSVVHRNRIKPLFKPPTPDGGKKVQLPKREIEKAPRTTPPTEPPLLLDRPLDQIPDQESSESGEATSASPSDSESESGNDDDHAPRPNPVVIPPPPPAPPPQRHVQRVANRLFAPLRPLRSNSTAPPAGPPPHVPVGVSASSSSSSWSRTCRRSRPTGPCSGESPKCMCREARCMWRSPSRWAASSTDATA